MKKTNILILALAIITSLGFYSCEREDEDNNGNGESTSGGWVDLDLPSGLLWASRNVGANSPEDYGDYFFWTETDYSWQQHSNGGGIIPTSEEWQELFDNTTSTWTSYNGVFGILLTGTSGNSIFLPAAGCRNYSELCGAGSDGYYWSSTYLRNGPSWAWCFHFDSNYHYVNNHYDGHNHFEASIRAVHPAR